MQATTTNVKALVLDAGPLLSLTPLKGLAAQYLTVPQVLDELKDKRAREHLEKLSLTAGVQVEVRQPDAAALTKVTAFAKKTGDYAVLSHTDLCVLALTYGLHEEGIAQKQPQDESATGSTLASNNVPTLLQTSAESSESTPAGESSNVSSVTTEAKASPPPESLSDSDGEATASLDDTSCEDDGEGEWITPSNVELHKSRALNLLPSAGAADSKTRRRDGRAADQPKFLNVGCMTADFAMQNVLLQMGLNLIGVEGKRISRVKTWVLRCHACFTICKDPAKKFCPSCGNSALLRTSVTLHSPSGSSDAEPKLQIHLKKNFQWRNRGTKYSIPSPKPGSSKTGTGEGLILREDQTEWIRANKRMEGRRLKEEKKMINSLSTGGGPAMKVDWTDPDWLPEMLAVGAGGKGRSMGKDGLPIIGYGRKNPNERKRRKK